LRIEEIEVIPVDVPRSKVLRLARYGNLGEAHRDADVVEVNALHRSRLEEAASRLGFTVEPWLEVIMKALNNTVQVGGEVYRGELRLSDLGNWHLTPSDIY